jgi:4-deoxy-L-threo-5-hexosulose-uronate ketol-isomerase
LPYIAKANFDTYSISMEKRFACSPSEVAQMNTAALRKQFLIDDLFVPGKVSLNLTFHDRFITGGAMPATEPLLMPNPDYCKAAYFLERREMGIINVGGAGKVVANGNEYTLQPLEALYLGKGTQGITFSSNDAMQPSLFYINSSPAHKSYPSKLVTKEMAEKAAIGSRETANERVINKLLINSVVETCQLQMGLTELQTGSIWNTMPAHTHDRRMEVYFYFNVKEGQSVCHFMGEPSETRHIWVQNNQAVISPEWSIHAGAGTSNYSFIWGMAGENLDYGDMDHVKIPDLR